MKNKKKQAIKQERINKIINLTFSTRQKMISVGRAFMPDISNHGTVSGMNARPTKCRVL